MKVVQVETLIRTGSFPGSDLSKRLEQNLFDAIKLVKWPTGKDNFTINPVKHGNGVKPIKNSWIAHLKSVGWKSELSIKLDLSDMSSEAPANPGPLDAAYDTGNAQYFCAEWETGNISSSHRALNKLALGIIRGIFIGGVLIVPSSKLSPYLTDRVGNYRELVPYFPVWRALKTENALLQIIVVEHDSEDTGVPLINKGTDGRALQ